MLKEQENPAPGSAGGGSIKSEPAAANAVVKEEPADPHMDPGQRLQHPARGGPDDAANGLPKSELDIPDIKPKLEDVSFNDQMPGCDEDQAAQQELVLAQQHQQPHTPHGGPLTPHTPHTPQGPHTPQPHTPQPPHLNNPNQPHPHPLHNPNGPFSPLHPHHPQHPNNINNHPQQQQQQPPPPPPQQQQQQQPPQQQAAPPQQHGQSMESHFMQQQSQVFVFSTQLANAAAECVLSGQHKSIISFHLEQPGTKKFLQTHPLKTSQFNNRGGNNLYSMANMRGPNVNSMKGPGPPGPMPGGPGSGGNDPGMASVAQWVHQQNVNLQQQGITFSPPNSGPNMNPNQGPFSPGGANPNNINFHGGGPPGPGPNNGGPWPPGSQPGGPQCGPGPNMQSPPPHGHMMGGPGPMGPGGPGGPNGGGPPGGPGGPDGQFMQQQMMGNMNIPVSMQSMMQSLGGPGSNLLHNKVPNENLTPEQLQRREEQLANLRKIQAMLFPEQHGGGGGPPGGMHPGNMNPNMAMMMGPGGPDGMGPGGPMDGMGPGGPMDGMMPGGGPMDGGMGPGPDGMGPGGPHQRMGPGGPDSPDMGMMNMMPNNSMPNFGPGGPGGPGPGGPQLPPNWDTMTPAQREWFKLQTDFYDSKRRRAQMEHMSRMHQMQNMNMPPGQGPPPPYFPMMRGRPGMPLSPTSPNGPMGSQGQPSPLPGDPYMFGGGGPRMHGPNPGPGGFMGGPRPDFDPMDPNMPPGGFIKEEMGKMPLIHRAGNPEQFHPPDLPGSENVPSPSAANANKPPPSYAQSQSLKRKRPATEDLDDLYKKLQPAPSPQQFNYLNQFEGQELTITKQLNAAFQETNTNSPARPGSVPDPIQALNSPLPTSTGTTAAASSLATTTTTSSITTNASSPMPTTTSTTASTNQTSGSGAAQRLSHFDPPTSRSSNSTPTNKSAMANITSASLANLAKGVEHLSNQMQQNMMQGGPFHNIQIQGQMSEVEGSGGPQGQQPVPPPQVSSGPGSNNSQGPGTPGQPQPAQPPPSQQAQQQQQQQQQQQPPPSQPQQQPPSVNNTYVNATMSIQQLNIQSVAHQQPGMNPSMQIQQMNSDMNMNSMQGGGGPGMPGGGPGVPGGGPGMPGHPNMGGGPHMGPNMGGPQMGGPQMGGPQMGGPHMGGPQMGGPQMGGPNMGGPNMHPGGGMPPNSMFNNGMHPGHMDPAMAQKMGMNPQQRFPGPQGGGMHGGPGPLSMPSPHGQHSPGIMSPGLRPQMSGPPVPNANVQIQAKAPNTIQYLPANPPNSQANLGPPRKDMDMMSRFPSPMDAMDSKMPPSSRQYFPGNGAHPQEMMSPMDRGMGPMGGMPGQGPSPGPMMMQQGMMMGGPRTPQSMGPGGLSYGPGPQPGMGPRGPPMGSGPMMGPMSGPMSGMMPGGPMSGPMQGGPMQGPMSGPMSQGSDMGPSPEMMHSQQMQMQSQQMQMQNQQMSMQAQQMSMQASRMQGPGGPHMSMDPDMMGQPGGGNYNAQYQQFQQQLYSQRGGPRPMSPGMGSPGMRPMGPGGMSMGPGGPMMQQDMGGPNMGQLTGPRGPGGPPMMGGPGGMGPGGNQFMMQNMP